MGGWMPPSPSSLTKEGLGKAANWREELISGSMAPDRAPLHSRRGRRWKSDTWVLPGRGFVLEVGLWPLVRVYLPPCCFSLFHTSPFKLRRYHPHSHTHTFIWAYEN